MLLPWLHLPRLQFEVIVHQKVSKYHFDLGSREESPRARPNAVAKVDIIDAGRGVLVLQLIALDVP